MYHTNTKPWFAARYNEDWSLDYGSYDYNVAILLAEQAKQYSGWEGCEIALTEADGFVHATFTAPFEALEVIETEDGYDIV